MAQDTRIFKCSCGNALHINFVTRKVTVMGREGERAGDQDEMVGEASGWGLILNCDPLLQKINWGVKDEIVPVFFTPKGVC